MKSRLREVFWRQQPMHIKPIAELRAGTVATVGRLEIEGERAFLTDGKERIELHIEGTVLHPSSFPPRERLVVVGTLEENPCFVSEGSYREAPGVELKHVLRTGNIMFDEPGMLRFVVWEVEQSEGL